MDNGICCKKEVNHAADLGIDVIVTDHHECTDALPNALAVINPKRRDSTYPFQHLAGVGVVYKLLCALESHINQISISLLLELFLKNILILPLLVQ